METAGIATVVIGSALDIVTWCNVPRYLHNDLPLGNPLGAPYDRTAQRKSIETAFQMISQMREPGVRMSDLAWPDGEDWKPVYGEVTEENREKLLQMGQKNRTRRAADKAQGLKR